MALPHEYTEKQVEAMRRGECPNCGAEMIRGEDAAYCNGFPECGTTYDRAYFDGIVSGEIPRMPVEVLNLKERYPFTCECGKEVDAAPSMFMSLMQRNLGGIYCPECKKSNHVRIDTSNTRMIEGEADPNEPLPVACYRVATPEEEAKLRAMEQK